NSILADPDQPISRLALDTREAVERAASAAFGPERDYLPVTLHELFEATVDRAPDAIAVEYGDHRFTYAEFEQIANALAHRLRALGVGPDVPVGICAP